MTRSLNQAFIKAYSKDKDKAASREQALPKAKDTDELLVVRFDTATCPIPPNHIADAPQKNGKPAVARVEPEKQQRSLDEGSSPEAPQLHAAQGEQTASISSALRKSIASQMLRAGDWHDQQIDAFIGGFPTLDRDQPTLQSTTDSTHERAERGQPVETGRFNEAGNAADAGKLKPPVADLVKPSPVHPAESGHTQSVRITPTVSEQPPGRPTSNSSHPSKPANEPSLVNDSATNHKSLASSAPSPTSPELVPPAGPALTPDSPQPEPLRSEPESESHLNERVAQGAIFRLDKPSYAGHSNDGGMNLDEANSGEHSSLIDSLSALSFSGEVVTDEPAVTAAQPAKPDSRQMESKLRQAKIRVFNPVWEVDSFQWPDVCLELLRQRESSLEQVARNLVGACQEGLQVLAITSPQSGEGRTTVACCLAKLAGSRGLKVAIVDGDIENPTLSYQTNLDVEQDWKTALVNQLPLEEVAVHSIDDQITLVPLVNPITQHEMSTDDKRIADMLRELSESFDLVIVDMGHMNSKRSLVTSLSEQGMINAVVAVVDHRSSTSEEIESCVRRIRKTGVNSIGLVENFAA
jgi:Mrp family chromosome partitioning ATPase